MFIAGAEHRARRGSPFFFGDLSMKTEIAADFSPITLYGFETSFREGRWRQVCHSFPFFNAPRRKGKSHLSCLPEFFLMSFGEGMSYVPPTPFFLVTEIVV